MIEPTTDAEMAAVWALYREIRAGDPDGVEGNVERTIRNGKIAYALAVLSAIYGHANDEPCDNATCAVIFTAMADLKAMVKE